MKLRFLALMGLSAMLMASCAKNSDIDDLQNQVNDLQNQVDDLFDRIESIVAIPTASDGGVEVKKSSCTLKFDVRPATDDMKTLLEQNVTYTFKIKETATKADGSPSLEVTVKTYDTTTGELSLTVSTSNFGDDFFKGTQTLSASLIIQSTGADKTSISSSYFPLYPEVGAYFLDSTGDINPVEYFLDDTATSYSYFLGRNNTSGEFTAAIENYSDSIFTVPSSVTFKDGSSTAQLTVTFSEIPATAAAVEFKIADANAAVYGGGYQTFKGSLIRLWESIGTGQFYDALVYETASSRGIQNVQILKSRIENRWRVVDPYFNHEQKAESWGASCDIGQDCPYIEFWEYKGSDGNTYLKWDEFWYSTLCYQGVEGSDIKGYLPSSLSSNVAEYDSYSKWYDTKVAGLYPYWYIDGLGGFGCYKVHISFPGGPDLEEWLSK